MGNLTVARQMTVLVGVFMGGFLLAGLLAFTTLNLRDAQYIPALQRGDQAAAAGLLPLLAQQYQEHRRAIDQLVDLATRQAATEEQTAAEEISSHTLLLGGLVLGLATLVSLFSGWVT